MLKSSLGIALFAAFFAVLRFVRARDGQSRFSPAGAQAVAFSLVCLLMSAGGLVFTAALD